MTREAASNCGACHSYQGGRGETESGVGEKMAAAKMAMGEWRAGADNWLRRKPPATARA